MPAEHEARLQFVDDVLEEVPGAVRLVADSLGEVEAASEPYQSGWGVVEEEDVAGPALDQEPCFFDGGFFEVGP
ncbi:hypothetical protein [Sinomonas susongensis]|uniref:hypothetical protein n=1 Tax=Sinomonas susongensis TaxID=1324851 RepID=UPI001109B68D|nr:hypothetical protein [Sinomonas susongensis]